MTKTWASTVEGLRLLARQGVLIQGHMKEQGNDQGKNILVINQLLSRCLLWTEVFFCLL